MGKPQARKKGRNKDKAHRRIVKAKNLRRFQDQIYEDLQPEKTAKLLNQPIDEDLPGLGQFYCVSCAKHFVNRHSLTTHTKTKDHKKQLKILKEKPYDLKEAELLNNY